MARKWPRNGPGMAPEWPHFSFATIYLNFAIPSERFWWDSEWPVNGPRMAPKWPHFCFATPSVSKADFQNGPRMAPEWPENGHFDIDDAEVEVKSNNKGKKRKCID